MRSGLRHRRGGCDLRGGRNTPFRCLKSSRSPARHRLGGISVYLWARISSPAFWLVRDGRREREWVDHNGHSRREKQTRRTVSRNDVRHDGWPPLDDKPSKNFAWACTRVKRSTVGIGANVAGVACVGDTRVPISICVANLLGSI